MAMSSGGDRSEQSGQANGQPFPVVGLGSDSNLTAITCSIRIFPCSRNAGAGVSWRLRG